jgi:hypothetical protein
MLDDVVVDTNVFVHAENPGEMLRYDESRAFIELMRQVETHLCLDDDDRIAGEYANRVPPGALAGVLLRECADAGRITIRPLSVGPPVADAIERLVVDRTDHKFVRVAHNSVERVLVTHDDEHVHCVAEELLDEVSVEVLYAYACCPRLQ